MSTKKNDLSDLRLVTITTILRDIGAILDSNKHMEISIDKIHQHIEEREQSSISSQALMKQGK